MKITMLGNVVAFTGFLIGAVIASLGGAEIWQEVIAGTAFAIALLAVVPGSL